jgi:hypothetical protein
MQAVVVAAERLQEIQAARVLRAVAVQVVLILQQAPSQDRQTQAAAVVARKTAVQSFQVVRVL